MAEVTIKSPKAGDQFGLDTSITVSGTAAGGIDTVVLYSPFGGTNFQLARVPVTGGNWTADVKFNTGGQRKIIADGLDADDRSRDFEPDEVTVVIGTGFIKPVRVGVITGRFGDVRTGGSVHKGVDIANSKGTPIFAVAAGKVTFLQTGCVEGDSRCGGGFGNNIDITHPNGLVSLYAHLNTVSVSNGASVSQGQQIGTMGSTGRSTGPHLHLEIRRGGVPLNPENFINPIV